MKIYVNCYDVFDAGLPFGGFKMSGLGRELGDEGLRPYLEPKTVVVKIV
jgi:aldehyde dehydrogenase (NAD+)